MRFKTLCIPLSAWLWAIALLPAQALPPPEDVPEEVLRTEIITEARSPFDGRSLSAAEYALIESRLRANPANTLLNPKVEDLVYLLRVRKLLRSLGIPIK